VQTLLIALGLACRLHHRNNASGRWLSRKIFELDPANKAPYIKNRRPDDAARRSGTGGRTVDFPMIYFPIVILSRLRMWKGHAALRFLSAAGNK